MPTPRPAPRLEVHDPLLPTPRLAPRQVSWSETAPRSAVRGATTVRSEVHRVEPSSAPQHRLRLVSDDSNNNSQQQPLRTVQLSRIAEEGPMEVQFTRSGKPKAPGGPLKTYQRKIERQLKRAEKKLAQEKGRRPSRPSRGAGPVTRDQSLLGCPDCRLLRRRVAFLEEELERVRGSEAEAALWV